jgi:alpha-1,6-mannosyltransferase
LTDEVFGCIGAGAASAVLVVAGGLLVGPQAALHGRVPTVAGYAAGCGGVVGLVAAWLWLGRILVRSCGTGRHVVVIGALAAWGLPLLCGPALFSRDIFSYAAQGREIAVGINPYRHGPAVLGAGNWLRFVSPTWSGARSPYGPLFLGIDGLIAGHVGGHAVLADVLLRLVSCGGVVLLAAALYRLASSYGTDPATALWLSVLNPLMLLHVVSGGHNEGLMLGLMVAGLVCARERRFASGLVLCLLAAAVKLPAALAALYVAADWMASVPDGAARVRTAVRMVATTLATVLTVATVAGLGWGWLATVATPTRIRTALSPTTDLGRIAGRVGHGFGLPLAPGSVLAVVQLAGLAVAVAVGVALFAGRWRRPAATGVGLTLLAVVAFGPAVQPWYLLWGLVPLAAACHGGTRRVIVFVSAGVSPLVYPNGSVVPDIVAVGFLAITAAVLAGTIWDRVRSDLPLVPV